MSELLHNLEIKWQLLAAQAINFFILLFLLKKFLYGPLLRFMRERREAIERGLKKSELAEQKFKELRQIQAKELAKTRKEAQKILDDARKRASDAQAQMINIAKEQAEALFIKTEKEMEQLKAQRLAEAEKEIGNLAIEGMEYLLKEKTPADKKTGLADEAIAHIKTIKNPS